MAEATSGRLTFVGRAHIAIVGCQWLTVRGGLSVGEGIQARRRSAYHCGRAARDSPILTEHHKTACLEAGEWRGDRRRRHAAGSP